LKIVHLATTDISGGAARAAYRLHVGLRRAGHDSRMLVLHKQSDDDSVIPFRLNRSLSSRISRRILQPYLERSRRILAVRPDDASHFSDDRSIYRSDILSQLPPTDVLQLHWVSGYIDYRVFFAQLPPELPVVWTHHDMNAFTGGCHFDGECGRFVHQCGSCPQLGSSKATDFSRRVWLRKHSAFSHMKENQLHIVTPSTWLHAELKRSSLLGKFPSSVIPYGLDTEIFAPQDKMQARSGFGIPPNAKVVLFLADWACERRKGLHLLMRAFEDIQDVPDLYFVAVGKALPAQFASRASTLIDSIGDDATMARLYSAADIFVVPSLQDNLPNTALEALACGTPTVAFATGGIPDIIRTGVEGKLVAPGDVDELRRTISELLRNDDQRALLALNARKRAVQEYKLQVQAQRYLELYKSPQVLSC
jgi:glycosyltransferase involved in cell wall biosynthesis